MFVGAKSTACGLVLISVAVVTGACSVDSTEASTPQQPLAEKVVNRAVVPPRAVRLTGPVGILGELSEPSCTHMSNATRYWRVSSGLSSVTSYLTSHPTPNMSVGPTGVGAARGNPAAYVFLNENKPHSVTPSLLYRYLSVGAGKVELRVDAFVLAKNGRCRRSPA